MGRCVSGYVSPDVMDRYFPHLWLNALRINDAPVCTAAEFTRFITAWHKADPNGTWNPDSIIEADGALIYEDECGKDIWAVVGMADDIPVYAIPGWDWVWDQTSSKEDS